jgi:hypothetical protein
VSLAPPHTPELEDQDAELVRSEHERKIVELQRLPAAAMRVVYDVELADGVATPVPHGLGRTYLVAIPSAPRGASTTGRIVELRDGAADRTRYVTLTATGWGATITVDVAVF